MTDHTALIERLEKAEAGSRELDAEICLALVPSEMQPNGTWLYWPNAETQRCSVHPRAVTTSIDAAVALVERMLPGWWWTAGKCGLTCHASIGPDRAFIQEPDLSKYDDGFHADIPNPSTPAIALIAALLKALRSQKGEG